MNELKNFVEMELKKLSESNLIATPETREQLENFAGNSNMLAVQMGVQYGFKLAMENVLLNIKILES